MSQITDLTDAGAPELRPSQVRENPDGYRSRFFEATTISRDRRRLGGRHEDRATSTAMIQ